MSDGHATQDRVAVLAEGHGHRGYLCVHGHDFDPSPVRPEGTLVIYCRKCGEVREVKIR